MTLATEYPTDLAFIQWVGASCLLDGRPAIVCGRVDDYATVATLPNGPKYEFAWITVDRIMRERGGRFVS